MGQPVSQGLSARKLFVNREALLAEFIRRVHDRPADDVLFLHGEGGIGKSLLLNHIEDHFARRLKQRPGDTFHPWMTLSQLEPKPLVASFSSYSAEKLPCVLIDFAQPSLGRNPQDRFDGLQMIRAGLGMPAPLFQAACVLYLSAQKMLTREWIERLFPGAGADLTSAIADQANLGGHIAEALDLLAKGASATTQIAAAGIGKGLWGVGAQYAGPPIAKWFARRALRGAPVADILQMKPGELMEALPALLAHDFNACEELESGKRIVLLFDAYDRFFGSQQDLSLRDRKERDAWFRAFLATLDLNRGIVAVVTAQEPPDWPEVRVAVKSVDYLATADAAKYLLKAEVEPTTMRDAITAHAEVDKGLVQPFFLALLVDAYRLEAESGRTLDPASLSRHASVQEKQQEIVNRLLGAAGENLADAIRGLSVCRAFDRNLFFALGDALRFAATDVMFQRACRLSCVREIGDGRYRVHGLMRRFVARRATAAHAACLNYFQHLGDAGAPDAIYHAHFLDPEKAAKWWITHFRDAVRGSLHEACTALLEVRRELVGENPGLHDAADEIGVYLATLGRLSEAEAAFAEAQQTALRRIGRYDSPAARNYLAVVLTKWTQFRIELDDVEGALEKATRAEQEFDRAVQQMSAPKQQSPEARGSELVAIYSNFGLLLGKLAKLQSLSDGVRAAATCEKAVSLFEVLLFEDKEDSEALINLSLALTDWAEFLTQIDDPVAADQKYERAVEACGQALRIGRNLIEAHGNQGLALAKWADFLYRRDDLRGAEPKYKAAVLSQENVLKLAKDDIVALTIIGWALTGWANVLRENRDYGGATAKYQRALVELDRALRRSNDNLRAMDNKGVALAGLAELHQRVGDRLLAEEYYEAAVLTFDRLQKLAPSLISASHNKARALYRWANLLLEAGEAEAARQKFSASLQAVEQRVHRARPGEGEGQPGKGQS